MPDKRVRLSSEARREQILNTATELFIERGFANVQMGDIAEQIGTSRPNIYTYFSSTHDVLEAVLTRQTEAFITALKQALAEDRAQTGGQVLDLLLEQRELVLLLRSAAEPLLRAHRQKVTAMMTAYVTELFGEQLLPTQRKEFEQLLKMQHNLFLNTAYDVLSDPESYDLDFVKAQLKTMLHAAYDRVSPQLDEHWAALMR